MPESSSNIGILFKFFLFFLVLAGLGYLTLLILPKLPVSSDPTVVATMSSINKFVSNSYAIIDNSFFFIFLFIFFLGLYDSYTHPSRAKAVLGLIELFVLAYLNLVIVAVLPAFSIFNSATLLPITTSFFNSIYKEVIVYFVIIITIIFNFSGGGK